jgi:hypothetical protein
MGDVVTTIAGDVFEKTRSFVKNFSYLLGRGGGGADQRRWNCPRCKGSGLLRTPQQPFWQPHQLFPPPNNAPCWFCEGIGVMPILGLSGFMIGCTNSVLSTCCKNPQRCCPPVKVQLCLGKFPETRCNFTTFKLPNELPDLLYDPNYVPSWLNLSDTEAVLASISKDGRIDPQTAENYRVQTSDMFMKVLNRRNSEMSTSSSSLNKTPLQVKRKDPRSTAALRFRAQAAVLQLANPRRFYYQSVLPWRLKYLSMIARRERSTPRHTTRRRGRSSLVIPRRSSEVQPVKQKGNICELEKPVRRTPAVLRSPRSRSPRRERNRVREDVKKEVQERAHKFHHIFTLTAPDHGTSGTADSTFGGAWSASNQMEVPGNWFQAVTRIANPESLWPHMAMSTKRLSVNLSSMNQVLYGKVKEGFLWPPMLGKAF